MNFWFALEDRKVNVHITEEILMWGYQ